jgi:hypothetical protein
VVKLAGHFVLKDRVQQEGGAAALKVSAMYPLRLGQDEPVRQLKKAG